jgi:Domain of unknown function (DUF4145)
LSYLQIKHRCPHCNELCDFQISQLSEVKNIFDAEKVPSIWDVEKNTSYGRYERVQRNFGKQGCGISRCPRCYNPVMFVVTMGDNFTTQFLHGAKNQDSHNRVTLTEKDIIVEKTYPEARNYDAHESWPVKVRKPFVDAQMMLDEGKSTAIIISACRSVLDVLTKEADGDGKNIFQRIEDLSKKGKITLSIKEWAHIVRELGNDATHDLDGRSNGEVLELINFIKLLLHVLFELPHTIQNQRLVEGK